MDAANSIRMFGGWIFADSDLAYFGNEVPQIGEHAAVAERTRMRIALNLNGVSLLSPLPSGLRKREEAECSRTPAATFTRLSGAPLISMMQSSNLGSSADTAVLWLLHRSRHGRIFGQG